MNPELLRANLLVWLGLFVLAFFNGAVREVGIKRVIDEPWAHHLSALTAILLFSGYVVLLRGKTGIRTAGEALAVGALWLVLTVLTETFVLNRWMGKLSWEQILATYDVTRGHLWPLVVIWIGLLPILVLRLKGPSS